MENIKNYLQERHEAIVDRINKRRVQITLKVFMFQIDECKRLSELVMNDREELQEIESLLAELDHAPAKIVNNSIENAYKHLTHLLDKEIERKNLTIDVAKNELFAKLRLSELKFANDQLKNSYFNYESKKYL